MRYTPTELLGVFLIDLEPRSDERGFFSRLFCRDEFGERGLESDFVQFNTSFTKERLTLRGLHYQLTPSAEVKVIKCIRGALWDVALDLRPDSPTFGCWTGAELSADNRRMMYLPAGCAHGFLTLTDDVEMIYFVSNVYDAELERIVRWNDPRFGIVWPETPRVVSSKDQAAPDFDPAHHLAVG